VPDSDKGIMMDTLEGILRRLTPDPFIGAWDRLEASPIGYRLAHGAFWSLMGTVASRLTGVIGSVVIARILGKAGYGELGIIQSTITTFAMFAGFGMGLTAAKHVAEFRRTDPDRATRIIGLSSAIAWITGTLMMLICVASANALATRSLAAPQLAGMLRLAAPLLLFGAVNGAQVGALNGFEAFRATARNNLIIGIVTLPFSVVGVLLAGLGGAIAAQVLSGVIATLLNFQVLQREARHNGLRLGYRGCMQEAAVIWKFSVPAVLGSIALVPTMWVVNVLLVNRPRGYEQMAILGAASQWSNVVLFLPNTLMQALLPIFSSLVSDPTDGKGFSKTLNLTQSLMVLIAFPTCTALMFSADWLMRLYWKAAPGDGTVMIGCLLAAFIECLGAAAGPAIQARSRMWFGFVISLSWSAVYLTSTAPLVGRFGAKALAFGQVLAYCCVTIWGFLYIKQDLPIGFLKRIFLGLTFAGFIATVCVATPATLRIWFAIPATLLAAIAAMRFLINPELRHSLRTALACAGSRL
jgi:O-antigen/teichoic acid export membrane protein